MSNNLIDVIKRASLDAMESGKPTDLRFGIVTSIKPLKVQISNQLTLSSNSLVVPQHLTDYTVNVQVKDDVEVVYKTMTIYNALKLNDVVALLRKAGGQQFLIVDRIDGNIEQCNACLYLLKGL